MAIHVFAGHPHAQALYTQLVQWCHQHLSPHHLWQYHSDKVLNLIVRLIRAMLKEIEAGGQNVKAAFNDIVGAVQDLWRQLVG